MPDYDIWESVDGTEIVVIPAVAPDSPAMPVDSEGRPLKRVKTISASGWDEAMQARNDHFGWGPYTPG